MKKTLSTVAIAEALVNDEYGGWDWNTARAMAEYLESMEEDSGEEMELDIVAIRCDFSAYETILAAAQDHGFDPADETDADADEDEINQAAQDWLEYRTTVIPTENNSVIIQTF